MTFLLLAIAMQIGQAFPAESYHVCIGNEVVCPQLVVWINCTHFSPCSMKSIQMDAAPISLAKLPDRIVEPGQMVSHEWRTVDTDDYKLPPGYSYSGSGLGLGKAHALRLHSDSIDVPAILSRDACHEELAESCVSHHVWRGDHPPDDWWKEDCPNAKTQTVCTHHYSCADKSRFLLQSVDQKWHCLRLGPQVLP